MICWQGGSTALVIDKLVWDETAGAALDQQCGTDESWSLGSMFRLLSSLWSNNITLWHCLHACHPVGVISLHIPRTWFHATHWPPKLIPGLSEDKFILLVKKCFHSIIQAYTSCSFYGLYLTHYLHQKGMYPSCFLAFVWHDTLYRQISMKWCQYFYHVSWIMVLFWC